MKHLVTVVFTIDRNLKYGHECIEHLRKQGFENPILKVFPAAPKGSSIIKLHHSIMENHYNVIQWFVNHFDSTYDIMICEDDCEFVCSNAASIIKSKLNILHDQYKWSVFLPGHIAFAPVLQTSHDGLARTLCPVTSHCYILNGKKLESYLNRIPRKQWTSPMMTEWWLSLPVLEKFAIFPSIATQNRQMKLVLKVPLFRHVSVLTYIRCFEYGMYGLPYVLLIVLLIIMIYHAYKSWPCASL